ncbi:unnamed protein product [Darwinula stevensoni]|uniref:Kelch-like protein diablo n=1 Tax=Darwinula stevensoni TaxID=69355 RepID=A0A7R8X7N3_9CRUS|nr:unnamed protein product [Darwinula stevensoni]CAG0883555.1 unnamed protein product [Darwinula stevensoni]
MSAPLSPQQLGNEPDMVVYQQKEFSTAAFPIMEEIRRQGKLCDITLKVDGHQFTAHRIVLASTIPYFQAMFTSDMLESKKKEINIQGVEPSTLEALINYAYNGKVVVKSNNVQSLLHGASFLQLTGVVSACGEFIQKRLTPGNVLGIRAYAETLGCFSLVEASDRFLQKHFVDVVKGEEFLGLSFPQVAEIFSRDELNVESEEPVFESLMTWMRHDPESRSQYLPDLLTKVRLPLLTPQFLADRVATEETIKSSHRCRDLLDEARDYHLMPERRYLLQSFRTRPRCCFDVVGIIYAVGGLAKSGDSLSTVEMYDPVLGRWTVGKAMNMLRSRVGVAVMGRRMYAIGGYNGSERLSTVEIFDPDTQTWSKASSMNCKRSALGALSLNNRLYVCGGYDGISSLNTVECYDPLTGKWSMISSMNKHRSAAGVVALDGCIYVLGGHDGLSIFDSVERYDPLTGKWTPVVSMLSKRCRLGAAALNGKLYVCGGYDGSAFLRTVEMYDPVENKWRFVSPMKTTRSRVALAATYGKLWAVGGYDGSANLSTVEMYNPETDAWTYAPSLCAHEGGVGIGVIPFNDSPSSPGTLGLDSLSIEGL